MKIKQTEEPEELYLNSLRDLFIKQSSWEGSASSMVSPKYIPVSNIENLGQGLRDGLVDGGVAFYLEDYENYFLQTSLGFGRPVYGARIKDMQKVQEFLNQRGLLN